MRESDSRSETAILDIIPTHYLCSHVDKAFAGGSIDFEHVGADLDNKVQRPLLVLGGENA